MHSLVAPQRCSSDPLNSNLSNEHQARKFRRHQPTTDTMVHEAEWVTPWRVDALRLPELQAAAAAWPRPPPPRQSARRRPLPASAPVLQHSTALGNEGTRILPLASGDGTCRAQGSFAQQSHFFGQRVIIPIISIILILQGVLHLLFTSACAACSCASAASAPSCSPCSRPRSCAASARAACASALAAATRLPARRSIAATAC